MSRASFSRSAGSAVPLEHACGGLAKDFGVPGGKPGARPAFAEIRGEHVIDRAVAFAPGECSAHLEIHRAAGFGKPCLQEFDRSIQGGEVGRPGRGVRILGRRGRHLGKVTSEGGRLRLKRARGGSHALKARRLAIGRRVQRHQSFEARVPLRTPLLRHFVLPRPEPGEHASIFLTHRTRFLQRARRQQQRAVDQDVAAGDRTAHVVARAKPVMPM